MMYCHNCGKEILNNSNFCPYCGQKITVIQEEIGSEEILDLSCLYQILPIIQKVEELSEIIGMCEYMINGKAGRQVLQLIALDFNNALGPDRCAKQLKKKYGIGKFITLGFYSKSKYSQVSEEYKQKLKKIIEDNSSLLSILPTRYLFSEGIEYLILLVQENRVSSKNQALDKLDEMIHKWNMEKGIDMATESINYWWNTITTLQITNLLIK